MPGLIDNKMLCWRKIAEVAYNQQQTLAKACELA